MTVLRYTNFKLRERIVRGDLPAWLRKHPRKQYIISCVLATPAWTNWKVIKQLELLAKGMSQVRGEPYVVDHIIPLNHPCVCGLNVDTNMQVIPKRCNSAKSNHWTEDQMELWPDLSLQKISNSCLLESTDTGDADVVDAGSAQHCSSTQAT